MSQYIDSICTECNGINHVEHKGEEVIHVTCQHCPTPHSYEHVVSTYSRLYVHATEQAKLHALEEMITDKKFARMSERTTVCLLIFENGYEITGRATVKNITDFRVVVGQDKAYEDALKRAMVAFGAILNQ